METDPKILLSLFERVRAVFVVGFYSLLVGRSVSSWALVQRRELLLFIPVAVIAFVLSSVCSRGRTQLLELRVIKLRKRGP